MSIKNQAPAAGAVIVATGIRLRTLVGMISDT